MISFTSQFTSPIRFRQGGTTGLGDFGQHGICAMEAVSIMNGCTIPYASTESVHPVLSALVIQVNDLHSPELDSTERADLLWPILPKLFRSREASKVLPRDVLDHPSYMHYPHAEFLKALGYTQELGYHSPWGIISLYSSYQTTNMLTKKWDFNKALHALKKGVEIFWDEAARHGSAINPQEDYTAEQVARLKGWALSLKDPSLVLRRDLVAA